MLARKFRQNPRGAFFVMPQKAPKTTPKKDRVREMVIGLRKQNLAIYDIRWALRREGESLSAVVWAVVLRKLL